MDYAVTEGDRQRITDALRTRAERFRRNAHLCERVGNRPGAARMRLELQATKDLLRACSLGHAALDAPSSRSGGASC